MANAIVARMQGDDYQARFFWIEACRLFDPHTKVVQVGYDLDPTRSARAFDDVIVRYATPIPDGCGGQISAEFYQIKFHVDHNGAFTYNGLITPKFIGASSVSLLQRLRDAQEQYAPDGTGARFWIVSPWQIDSADPLCRIISQSSGEIRLHVLFNDTTDKSEMGKVRKLWRDHLGFTTDNELRRVLRPLRIRVGAGDLLSLQDRLNDKLQIAGLEPVPSDRQVHPYDDLIKKLRAEGRSEFTRSEMENVCRANGLWRGRTAHEELAIQVGLRSFLRWAEHMEDETNHMLCLLPHFDGRTIRDPNLWAQQVFPDLLNFIETTMRDQAAYHLHIDAHSSIAFAAGYCLDTKSGARILPVQKTRKGRIVWDPFAEDCIPGDNEWCLEEHRMSDTGSEVALALCVTQDALDDVRLYVERALPEVGRVFMCRAGSTPGQASIRDGVHAQALAQSLSFLLKTKRSALERQSRLHIFAAAPNALMFFIGQHSRSFGKFTLYEFDLDTNTPGAYLPSLSFPPTA